MLPFSAATLWRKVKAGEFPAPVKLSAAVTAWRREEVEAWMAVQSQPAAKRRSRRTAALDSA
ncbi:AlpA family transcriptional regulator [Roseateles sp.]|uniref:helix-turn-helix transcriptional regulator n=1 Tax=Roseateles sp. TaxID=1971397 RepID=UPI0025D9CCE2|nr:AlpA family phage regulatory protein [Roseateles sp.]MBV8037740.1 AlpA family phage regulatory protein [Roseateles sp.]